MKDSLKSKQKYVISWKAHIFKY